MKHVEADTGIEIPLDMAGAEYLVLMSSMEIINFPEYLAAISQDHEAGRQDLDAVLGSIRGHEQRDSDRRFRHRARY